VEEFEGIVEAKKKDKTALKIGEDWFSSYMGISIKDVEPGDRIRFTFKKNGRWNNIQGDVDILEKGDGGSTNMTNPSRSEEPVVVKQGDVHLKTERAIIRQNALTNAVKYASDFADRVITEEEYNTPENIIEIAKKFEAYTSGDLDLENAKKAFVETSFSDIADSL